MSKEDEVIEVLSDWIVDYLYPEPDEWYARYLAMGWYRREEYRQ